MLTIFESLSGLRGSSFSMIFRMRSLDRTDENTLAVELLMPLWKKYFISNTPWGVCMYCCSRPGDGRIVHAMSLATSRTHQRAAVFNPLTRGTRAESDDAGRDLVDRLLPLIDPI